MIGNGHAGFGRAASEKDPHGHLADVVPRPRRPPRLGTTLERRQEGQDPLLIAIAWKAQQRLHHLWRRLDEQRGKRRMIVAVAVARQLAAFCWAIVTHPSGCSVPVLTDSTDIRAGGLPPHADSLQPRSTERTAA